MRLSVLWVVGVWLRAGVRIGQTRAPTKGATAGGGSRPGSDDVIDEVNGQGLHGWSESY